MIGEIIYANFSTVIVIVGVVILYLYLPRRQKGVPNGPFVFPVVGNLPALMSRDVMGRFDHLRKKYGDIYGLYFGKDLTVVLNGYDVIHEALVKKGNQFSVRPRSAFHKLVFKNPGIVFANDSVWKEQRQFAQMALNEFGYSWTLKTMEERINEEVGFFINRIGGFVGPFDIRESVNLSVANVIAGILFGRRCSYNDPAFVACLDGVGEAAKLFARAGILMNCVPFLRNLPGDLIGFNKIEKIREKPQYFLNRQFSEHMRTFDEKNINHVVDLYLKEINDSEKYNKVNSFNTVQMRSLMGELLSAGSETTAITIVWIILYILINPDVQKKLHNDIDEVIGQDRPPSLDDRTRLPYVEATILEGLRIAPVAPLSVPHAVHNDVIFRGQLIPKDTTVFANLHSVLKDPLLWPKPDVFKPARFLDGDGKLSIPKEFIPFSIGRRSCLGESLARMELFLYMTSLLQKFELSIPEGDALPSVAGHLGMTYNPNPFRMLAKCR